ncbi:GTP-binding protein A [Orchesella cincta]|uniref:GTP-binding protein A n=1 Tax=Orchesella cincta TaxID=48709 RepID=A0A1D2MDH9_ORCCI|nr:GTP-binding protein A [Orchesella cincta]
MVPPLVDVPESVDEIIGMLRNGTYGRHPGLVAALNSMKGKRSGKNAYILLLGSTGAGKSSAINLLFDNPDITKTGDTVSTTTDIHEFRVPVPIDELGISNSELRVIDTPGLGDTRGLEQDAKFLATFESFLDKHEELKDRIPNVVLIFHKYNDNRFKGEGANFVKMIRGLDHFRTRITDENFSNVIFVFSHFCSETPANKRRPTARLNQFKQVIEDYSSFPKPILLAVAENKAKQEWQLPVLNGFYKMPNNEYYPRNLFDKLELVTKNGGDMVGMGVFRTAFRNSENFNVTPSDFTLVDKDSTSVTKFLRILSNAVIGVVELKFPECLLRKQFHNSLQVLQKTLHLRNIIGKQDLPKTATDILHLLTAIKHDEATRLLLEKGLGIKPPVFGENPIAGHGYNVFMDRHLATSPFDLQENTLSDIGFMIPKVLTCKLDKDTTQNFRRFADKEEYIQHRLHSLGIKGELPPSSFKGVTKAGHNIESESFKNDSCSLSATREFRFFDFIINDRVPFTKEFESDVKSLPVFDQGNHESVTKWNAFFNEYGTHVVKSVHGGGAIEITLESAKPFNDEMSQALFDVIKFAEDMTFLIEDDSNGTSNGTRTVLKEGTTHSLTFHGGNPKFYTSDLTKLGIEEAVNLMNNWKNSLKYNPAVLTTEMRLEPMSHVVRKLGQNYSSEIEKATELLFNASLTYDPNVAKASAIPPPRDQTAFLDAIAQMNKQMQAILLQNAEAQRRSEERQHNMTLARMEFEREEKERERIYQMQLEQARQNATIHQQKLQADLEQQRIKAANETEQRHKALVDTMIKAQEDADARRLKPIRRRWRQLGKREREVV